MSWPEPVGQIVHDMDLPITDRFPFFWWATGARFDYNEEAKHLFCKLGSAAEAFFFRPFVYRAGVQFTDDRAFYGPLEVIPQHIVGKYKVDFAVHQGATRLAVEIDGMAFHQRSADQVEADYLRARRIIASGYTVVRFTAKEAFRDAAECWRQLDAIIDRYPASRPRLAE